MLLLPFAEPCSVADAVSLHPRDVEAVIGHWEKGDGVGPVLKDTTIDCSQIVQERRLIVRTPCPKCVMMCALDHGDGIDLKISQMLDRLYHTVFPGELIRVTEKL